MHPPKKPRPSVPSRLTEWIPPRKSENVSNEKEGSLEGDAVATDTKAVTMTRMTKEEWERENPGRKMSRKAQRRIEMQQASDLQSQSQVSSTPLAKHLQVRVTDPKYLDDGTESSLEGRTRTYPNACSNNNNNSDDDDDDESEEDGDEKAPTKHEMRKMYHSLKGRKPKSKNSKFGFARHNALDKGGWLDTSDMSHN